MLAGAFSLLLLLAFSLTPLAAELCQLRQGQAGMCFAAPPLLSAGGLLPNIVIAAAPRLMRGGRGRCALEAEADDWGTGSDQERDREDDASCVRICRYKKFFYEGETYSIIHSLPQSLTTSFGPLETRWARFKPIDIIILSRCPDLLGGMQAERERGYQPCRDTHGWDVTWHSTCIIIFSSRRSETKRAMCDTSPHSHVLPAAAAGQVCVGCFRDGFEIRNWSKMSEQERQWSREDAADRRAEWVAASAEGGEEESGGVV